MKYNAKIWDIEREKYNTNVKKVSNIDLHPTK